MVRQMNISHNNTTSIKLNILPHFPIYPSVIVRMTDIDTSVGDIILDNEPPPDCDSVGDASSFFPLKFHQSTSACVGLDMCRCSIAQLYVSKSHVCSLSNTGQVNLIDVGETSLGSEMPNGLK